MILLLFSKKHYVPQILFFRNLGALFFRRRSARQTLVPSFRHCKTETAGIMTWLEALAAKLKAVVTSSKIRPDSTAVRLLITLT